LRVAIAGPRNPGCRAAKLTLFLLLPLQYLLVGIGWRLGYMAMIPVCAGGALAWIALAPAARRRFAALPGALLACVYGLSFVPALQTLRVDGAGEGNPLLIAWLLLVVQASDVLQYVWGKLAGRHAIAPSVSPKKTVEGTVGGIASATALGAMLSSITPFSCWQAGVIALAVTLIGFLGGLALSALKRHHGAKDWGTVIVGHGGMLDRVDSLIFTAPVFFQVVSHGFGA
jgi:phosphatidate cytidylyltransferase